MANKTIPEFTELNAAPSDADTLLIYDASAASPRTRSITAANLVGVKTTGPASATDNAVARFDATTGKLLQNSTAILSDAGNITGATFAGLTITTTTGTLSLTSAKTLTVTGTLTFAGTDGSTLNVGAGGTLGTAAFTAATAYVASFSDPNADRLVFWDDSAGAYAALTAGTGLSISGTTLSVASSVIAGITVSGTPTTGQVLRATSATTATWQDVEDALSLPSGSSIILDARLLAYANNTPIDNASAKWTDTSGNSNHAVQATSNLQPLVKTATSETGIDRTILFSPTTNADSVTLTTPVSLTGAFTVAIKFKTSVRDGGLFMNAGSDSYVVGIYADAGEITASASIGDDIDLAEVAVPGTYHSAPTGVFYNDGIAGNATFTTTLNGSGGINSVTIGGTNTGYAGDVTAVFNEFAKARFATGPSGGIQYSPAVSSDLADSNFHNLIVTRNASNLVTWELDGTSIGTATISGTISAGRIGLNCAAHIECTLLYTSEKTGTDITAIRGWME